MKVHPVSIRQPEIGALVADRLSVLIRPLGRLAVLGPGDLLWVREPFFLPAKWARLKPAVAAAMPESTPIFAADCSARELSTLARSGRKCRMTREMPKAWHRQYLRIAAIDKLPLHEVAEAELLAPGWRDVPEFARRWNETGMLSGAPVFARNPIVLRIAFDRIAGPAPSI